MPIWAAVVVVDGIMTWGGETASWKESLRDMIPPRSVGESKCATRSHHRHQSQRTSERSPLRLIGAAVGPVRHRDERNRTLAVAQLSR